MSQNIRAAPCASARQGKMVNVAGSGFANISDSNSRANPSIAEPSKPIPSSKAFSSSAGAIATDFNVPRMSVNHRRIKRISRSSMVRRTNSCCLLMFSDGDMWAIVPKASYGSVTKLELAPLACHRQAAILTEGTLRDLGARWILAALIFSPIDHRNHAHDKFLIKACSNQRIAP